MPPENSPLRLYPVDQVTLLHKALANLGFRVTMLHLLGQAPAIVRDLYQKLGHVLIRNPASASHGSGYPSPPKSSIQKYYDLSVNMP